jgi:D-glycero-alpha-D-manno-heptose-7-phosphate kinase
MLIRGKAPLRVSFSGGGSDVSPYCDEYGGCVLSTTIGMYAMGSLSIRNDNQVKIFSVDYNEIVHYELGQEINEGDKLSFLCSVVKRLNPPRGLNLYLHCDAPPGTGLGSSGTISALIVGLINHAFNFMLTKYEMARIAYQIEHDDLGRAVGRQDHYAAVFGGMNFMEFGRGDPVVFPLRVEPWILEELGYHLQMFYTRKKRDSTEMKALTRKMMGSLLQGKLKDFGHLLNEAWLQKQRMNPGTVNPYLSEIYEEACRSGAIGGKLLGAGGGGFFIFFTPFTKKGKVAEALVKLGAQPTPLVFDFGGMQTWQVSEQNLSEEASGIFTG